MSLLRADPARLLEIDAVANLALGALLLALPHRLMRILGLPSADQPFYPRVLGGVLSGIGAALLAERLRFPETGAGLGLAGAIAVNLCGAASVVGVLASGGVDLPVRGKATLWALSGLLVGLSGLELQARRVQKSNAPVSADVG